MKYWSFELCALYFELRTLNLRFEERSCSRIKIEP
jgi:hypothetical protein